MIRPAAVAGTFYPAEAGPLRAQVASFLDRARPAPGQGLRALVAPHAGYLYSGPMAGAAYALLRLRPQAPRRVLLLGPSHRVALAGMALSSARAWDCPLGAAELDHEAAEGLRAAGLAEYNDRAHAHEHSLETQLPFLRTVLPGASLLPVLVGDASAESVAGLIQAVLGPDRATLLVLSTDLSHYLPYALAQAADAATCRAVLERDAAGLDPEGACGYHPLRGLLMAAGHNGWTARTLALGNSGDTAGKLDQVVGYGAWAFEERDGLR